MSSIKHEYNSSVERHMLANQKVWVSIVNQGVPRFCCHVLIDTSFYTEITRKNTSSKHGRYTRNVANRNSSLKQVYNTCFSFFDLVFWMLAKQDKHDLLHEETLDQSGVKNLWETLEMGSTESRVIHEIKTRD